MDAIFELARNVAKVRYEDIPEGAIEATKKDILDILGTTLAGSSSPNCRSVVELVKDWDGKKEATIIGYGGKAPSILAAMANGVMAHTLDFDDTHDRAILHAGVAIVPASFAVAERLGGVGGKDFLTAVALGIDLTCRLGMANLTGPFETGWHFTAIYGYFGAAAAAGKLLGLDEEGLINAFGIAYAQSAGNSQFILDGAFTKMMQAGFAAKGGLLSALLAQKGITGTRESLEGEKGLFRVYHKGEYDPKALTADLGKKFEVENLSFKPYPCCRYVQPYIDAALGLATENDINPDDVDQIITFIGHEPHDLCEPLEIKRRPRVAHDAKFSIPYTVAAGILRRKVGVDDFKEEAFTEPAVLKLTAKVIPKLDPSLATRDIEPGKVEVRMNDGRTYSKRVDYALGHPKNPMTMEDLIAKFKGNAALSVKKFPANNLNEVINMVCDMEEVADVTRIIKLLG